MNIIFLNLTDREGYPLYAQANEIAAVQRYAYSMTVARRVGSQLTFKHGNTLVVAEMPNEVMALMAKAAAAVDGGIAPLD